jgi:hypothetical protein
MKRKQKPQLPEPDEIPDEPIFPERRRARVNDDGVPSSKNANAGEHESDGS